MQLVYKIGVARLEIVEINAELVAAAKEVVSLATRKAAKRAILRE